MKKSIKIIMIFALIMFILFANSVKAANEATVTATPNKTTLAPGDELKVNILASNIGIENGIMSYGMKLVYDKNVFDIQIEDRTENQSDLEEMANQLELEEVNILSMDPIEESEWNLLLGKSESENLIIGSNEEAQTTNQQIGQIKFIVKDTAVQGSTSISLNTITVGNEEITSETGAINDINLSLTIGAKTLKTTSTNTNQNIKAGNSIPKTGVEDALPIMFIAITISAISYMQYKRYKNI